MAYKIDKIDLRILYELDRDCRTPLSQIAEKIRKSPQYVKYRVERLKEEQIIRSVALLSGYPENCLEYCAFLRLKGSDIIGEKTLIDFIFKMPETHRLYLCDGEIDIIATFIVQDFSAIDSIKNSLTSNFPIIDTIHFNQIPKSEIFGKKFLIQSAIEPQKIIFGKIKWPEDEDSQKMLSEFGKNPFASSVEMAKNLGISYDKAKYFFKKNSALLKTTLILSNSISKKAILLLDASGELEKIRRHCEFNNNITQIDSIAGENNFAVYFECPHDTEINRPIKEFLYMFRDSIRRHSKIEIINIYKHRWQK